MREILGRRRRLLSRRGDGRPDMLSAALTFATQWRWPVVPGSTPSPHGQTGCGCPDPQCAVPGGHPFDPPLLAATTDERMVRWWWTNRPTAPVLLATGGKAPSAISLPALPAAWMLAELGRAGLSLGPVVVSPTRWSILVRPYSLARLGELLHAKDHVPGSLRFHGEGGYLALPGSETGEGRIRWERDPLPGSATPWLPDVEPVVDAAVEALARTGVSAPDF